MTRTGTAVGLLVMLAIVGTLLAVTSAHEAALGAPYAATLAAGFTLSAAACICTAAVLFARGDRRD